MSSLNTQRFETDAKIIPIDVLQRRRRQEKIRENSRRVGRGTLLAAGLTSVLVAASAVTNRHAENPRKTQLKAALIAKERPTANSNIVTEPYTVGPEMKDVMLSEVAADLHPLSTGNQKAMDAIDALNTYLTPVQAEQPSPAFDHGEHINIAINKSTGDVLPKADLK